MKLLYNLFLIVCLLPAVVTANTTPKGKYTKEKVIKKEFTVNANAGLHVDNSYGNIHITTWNENRTVIEVLIKTNGDDEAKVQKKLDGITVNFSANGSLVQANTLFEKESNSWSFWGSNNSRNTASMEVHYTIKLPLTNSVNLSNDYGAIHIDKLKGNAKINCDYGQLIIGELLADDNYLSFDYTDKSTIGYIKSGKINADYSGFTVEKAEQLDINADYSRSEIKNAGTVNYNCDYGKVTIENANNIMGRGDYVTTRIGAVKKEVNINSSYGSIEIEQLKNSVKNVTINADYTGIKIGLDPTFQFDFIVNFSYASFNGENLVTVTNSSKDSSNKRYSGYRGASNSGNYIHITSSYGGVSFFRN